MKRSLAIVLAAAVLLLLAACGSKKQPAASPNTQSAPVAAEPDRRHSRRIRRCPPCHHR